MTWAKLDDQFYLNPKNAPIDRDEQDLYIAGLVYCNGQLTDGFIHESKLMQLYIWAKLPFEANALANAQAIASRLLEHEMWEIASNGYQVHDFLDWNPSKSEVLALRKARSEAGKLGGERSGEARRAESKQLLEQMPSKSSSKNEAKTNPVPVPVPVPEPGPEPVPGDTATPRTPDPKAGKPSRPKTPKPEMPPDPTLQNAAVLAYREKMRLTPNATQRKAIADAVSNTSLDRWSKTLDNWLLHGWKPTNVPGMLESFSSNGSNGKSNTGREPVAIQAMRLVMAEQEAARAAEGGQ